MIKNNKMIARRQIDSTLKKTNEIKEFLKKPKLGWVKIMREALGMSAVQLSKRLKVSPAAISKVEKNEQLGSISLNTLKKVAEKLDCELIYFLCPKEGSIEKTVEKKTYQLASKIIEQVSHTMALEDQGISEKEKKQQLNEIYNQLLHENSNRIWDVK